MDKYLSYTVEELKTVFNNLYMGEITEDEYDELMREIAQAEKYIKRIKLYLRAKGYEVEEIKAVEAEVKVEPPEEIKEILDKLKVINVKLSKLGKRVKRLEDLVGGVYEETEE